SVNLWGIGMADGFYIASGEGGKSGWAQRVARDPLVRLRIGDKLFELRAELVTDETQRLAVAEAYKDKYDLEAEEDFPDVLLYRLSKR
ncbi:MAG: nitroreductase family deazaflavin-dependent oxidoreductase, partial [Pseudomonadales bacterium]|nr:nitroreductase family deazaflavin-dependent oxidoreductase [Pseudomonadales bacterium]